MVSAERITALKALGYEVEDMGSVWGAVWAGQYRWNDTLSDNFQDWGTCNNEANAWERCDEFATANPK